MKEFDSGSGAAIADRPAEDAQFVTLDLNLITPSLTNRKTFDQVKLQELADNIKARGVRFPIVVRPLPAARLADTAVPAKGQPRPTHEIVSGERRYRASQLAGKTTIPAIVRTTDDQTSLEDQLIENLQREDLTDLQEAEGYHQLMELSGISANEVAKRLNLGTSYVHSHIKLLDLSQASKQALVDKVIDYSRALLIARIPNDKLQEKAVKAAAEKNPYTGQTPSLRDFQTWLRQNVMLRLDTAPFTITDINLIPAAGSCKDCPKRTGANPELFAEVDGADICTDPVCYADKAKQHRAVLIEKAEAKGMRIVEGKEAKALFKSQYSSEIKGYSRLDQKRADVSDDRPTLKKLLGADVPGRVLIENPHTKELIEAIPTEEAEALLITKGLLAKASKSADKAELEDKIKALREKTTSRVERETRTATFAALVKKVRATKDDKAASLVTAPMLRAWLEEQRENYEIEDQEWSLILGHVGKPPEDIDRLADEAVGLSGMPELWRLMALVMMCSEYGPTSHYPRKNTPLFDAAVKTLRLDVRAISEATKDSIKAEVAEEIKQLRADAAAAAAKLAAKKPPTTGVSLAQPKSAAGVKNAPAAAGAKTGKKPGRLSPEDAKAGIAEAMQGLEGKAAATALHPMAAWPFPTASVKPAATTSSPGEAAKLAIGQQVAIASTPTAKKYRGRTGTIYAIEGDQVSVHVVGGDRHTFSASELTVLPVVAPLACVLKVGARVTVNGPMVLRPSVARFSGLLGTVTAEDGDDWVVKLDVGGRGGGVRTFLTDEIEAVLL